MVLISMINIWKIIRNKIKQGNKRTYAKGIKRIDHMMGYFGVGVMVGKLQPGKYPKVTMKMKIRKMEMKMDRVTYIVI